MSEVEVWKDVPRYEGVYQVSSLGRVRSLDRIITTTNRQYRLRGKLLRPALTPQGYPAVNLCNRHCHSRKVCQIVADAFIGPRPNGKELRHLDGDKLNSNLNNLAYGTHQENMLDMWNNGTMPYGELLHNHKLKSQDVSKIKQVLREDRKASHRLARIYGVDPSTIYSILNGKTWKHIAWPVGDSGILRDMLREREGR